MTIAQQFQALYQVPESDLYSGQLGQWYSEVMSLDTLDAEIILNHCGPNAYVADLMCGDARILRWLDSHGCQGVGVDISEAAIKRAKSYTVHNSSFFVSNAFSWLPSQSVDFVVLGGLVGSMFSEDILTRFLHHIYNFLPSGAGLWLDYLVEDSNEFWKGDFIFPSSNPLDQGFVVSSTVRDSSHGMQESSFFYSPGESTLDKEFSSHKLFIFPQNKIEEILIDCGFKIKESWNSYQFDPDNVDDAVLPSWPIRKVVALR